jgi:predicted deacetylase
MIAVSLHDVEPATFERCALIRDWLDDHGVDRVTLLVIPAPDLHPFHDRRPELAEWLDERAHRGDAIAQHGFQHRQLRRASPARQLLARALLRLELHPADLDHPRGVGAVEKVLRGGRGRVAVTYDDLAGV